MLPQDEHGKSIRDVFAAQCAKDNWASATRNCMLDTKTLHDGHHCKDRLTAEQRSALDGELEALEKKRAAELPKECERYRLLVVKLGTCDKLPEQSRDVFKQQFELMAHTWKNLADMPADARRVAIEGCKQSADTIDQIAHSLCGW